MMGEKREGPRVEARADWSTTDWPSVEYDDEKSGRLIWTDRMFDVIEGIHHGDAEHILPHVPEELLRAMISDYAHEIDGGWFMDYGGAFVREFERRRIPLEELLSLLPDMDDYQLEFAETHQMNSRG